MQHPFVKRAPSTGIVLSQAQIDMLARKRGLEAVAAWAAECMGLSAREASEYERTILNAFSHSPIEMRLLCRIQTDIERAGKPALSTYAGTIFTNAAADALTDLEGHAPRARSWASVYGIEAAPERAY